MNEKILTILHWLFCFFSIFEIIVITSLIFNAAKNPEKWKKRSVLIFVHFHLWKKICPRLIWVLPNLGVVHKVRYALFCKFWPSTHLWLWKNRFLVWIYLLIMCFVMLLLTTHPPKPRNVLCERLLTSVGKSEPRKHFSASLLHFSLVPFSYLGKILGKTQIRRAQIFPWIKVDKYQNKYHSCYWQSEFTHMWIHASKSDASEMRKDVQSWC